MRALHRSDTGDAGPLAELLARAVLTTLHWFIVPTVAGPDQLVPLLALSDATISTGALRIAAERGRLNAHQELDFFVVNAYNAFTAPRPSA